ncbi:MAG: APC family permease [Mobilitalea sp.]
MKDRNQLQKEHYGLATATTMIIGIVIGTGIFFKCDDVLGYTGGSIGLGVLVFCIGAFGIIFGSLTLTELSIRTEKNGGFVGYYEDFISKKIACGFGWFQTFVYYPTLIVVVAWVAGIYTCLLFGLDNTLEMQVIIGLGYMVMIYAINILSVKLGGYLQNASTLIKLIPLLGIALVSFFWSAPYPLIEQGVEVVSTTNVGWGWMAALAPIAFSYDGWIIATSITNEVKNPKKNMTLALIIGPIIVLIVYVSYFIGFNKMLGAEYILTYGNAAVDKVGELLLGKNGSKIILTFILISVVGVLNGIVLGSLRMPQALASKNMIPFARQIDVIHARVQLSIKSCLVSFVLSVIWMVIHYISQKTEAIVGGDISEISIVFSYACYIILYAKVIKMKKDNIVISKFKGIICPVFGILGSSIIFIGGFISNPVYVLFFVLFCVFVCILGYLYYKHGKIGEPTLQK